MTEEKDIELLTDYQHARLRTEMYLGSRVPTVLTFPIWNSVVEQFIFRKVEFVPAALTAFREAIDNSLDELSFLGKGWIEVLYPEETSTFSISDSGRGIPLTWKEEQKMHAATLAVSHTKAGRNFGERGEQSGTNGLGISVVNFCSEFFDLSVRRDGKHFVQRFSEGETELDIMSPTITVENKQKRTGTDVRFSLSEKVFVNGRHLPTILVESVVRYIASTNHHIKFKFNGEDIKVKKTIQESLFAKQPVFTFEFDDGNVRGQYFVGYGPGDQTDSFAYVNNVPAYNGGTHDDAVKYHFPRRVLEHLAKEMKRRKLNPNKNDILDGLSILGWVKMKAPNFDSQSKTRLTNIEVQKPIDNSVIDADWPALLKQHKEFVELVFARCAARTGKKDLGDIERNAKKLEKVKIAKLIDATSKDRKDCVLFITEGDSAAGGINNVRDSEHHGVMPLRGKVKNVWGEKPTSIVENKVILDMCAAIGLVPGKKADIENLRYPKVYIMADADDDGQGSICPLVVNFFYTYWPELFTAENPVIHVFLTPLIILTKGKEDRYFYTHNYHDFKPREWKGWEVTRAKGLASMMSKHFSDHIFDPPSIPVVDDLLLPHVLSLLFNGGRADDRKTMIANTPEETALLIEQRGSDWRDDAPNTVDI